MSASLDYERPMLSSVVKSFWPDTSLIQGIVRFRWIAIIFMMVGTVPLLESGYLLKEQLFYFMAVVALLAVFNGLTQGIWSKTSAAKEQSLLFVQLLVDLLAVAGLLFVSGSAANPFIAVLTLHAFLGGMLLINKRSLLFAVILLGLLGILQSETNKDLAVTLNVDRKEMAFHFLFQWVVVVGAWFVARLFSVLLEKQEERIRSLQNRQHRADRLKSLGALAAGFSHEMATPLNSLKLRLDRGVRKLGDPVAAHAEIQQAQLSLDECISIFQKMVGVFATSAEGDLQKLNVHSVLQDIVQSWEADNKIILNKEWAPGELFCRLQPLSFAQTVFDLLDNAKEASGSVTDISLRVYQNNGEIVIEVVDAGSGVSAEIIERLGEPFNTNKQNGNGLGVYSAMMTAQSMGGEFSLRNNSPAKGATARLSIPYEESK
ncbi:sensor histidine kinase [Bdellovibrio sp. KM01]|uniref:sensor histidine kinase n=1 Tax=Bdellovibrio sp. KM01 TaxID=2748865 RepID=UPI00210538B0|nr:HAMP domain-containing sensor histidine kinase [Bdellovibrio sp. KM01]